MSNVKFKATRPPGNSTNDYNIYMEKDAAPPVLVARVYDNLKLTHEENQEVKNLVEAAPELLEALSNLYESMKDYLEIDDTGADCEGFTFESMIQARNALAKAEGTDPEHPANSNHERPENTHWFPV